jgi:hypothetical protein
MFHKQIQVYSHLNDVIVLNFLICGMCLMYNRKGGQQKNYASYSFWTAIYVACVRNLVFVIK